MYILKIEGERGEDKRKKRERRKQTQLVHELWGGIWEKKHMLNFKMIH